MDYGKIADDIQRTSKLLDMNAILVDLMITMVRKYATIFHNIAVPIPQAKHNSVFYTHLNHTLSEMNLVDLKDKFDLFICMSAEDAQFMVELI